MYIQGLPGFWQPPRAVSRIHSGLAEGDGCRTSNLRLYIQRNFRKAAENLAEVAAEVCGGFPPHTPPYPPGEGERFGTAPSPGVVQPIQLKRVKKNWVDFGRADPTRLALEGVD